MELYQLRSFVTVAQQGHLTRAAERLHISQPAVSAQIKALEEELGVTLFQRKAGGVALTKAGQALLPQAEKILASAKDLIAQAKSLQGQISGKVRIGTIIDPEFLRLGEFMNTMLVDYPMLAIELHQGISGWVMNGVVNGDLDAGFFLGNQPQANVTALELRKLTYRIVAPPDWKAKVEAAGWKEIAALPWIWTPKLGTHHQMVTELFRQQNLEPVKAVEADQESIIINLVTAGVGLSLMREDLALAAAKAGEIILWDKGRSQTTLCFIYRTDRASDPVINASAQVLKGIWGLRQ